MRDVAFLIPARCEEFLNETIADLIAKCKSDYEIIVVLDGSPAVRPIPQHERVSIIILPESIGQRAATNLAARISKARYVCKLDAHCGVDQDFDTKLIEAGEKLGHDVTQVPAMLNWHVLNWKCQGCGKETYQGPEPSGCSACMSHGTTGGPFERVMYWDDKAGGVPGRRVRSDFWRLDTSLVFQYFSEFKNRPEAKEDIVDVMTSIGACFFMRRDRFFEISGLDEAGGSYGQFGCEIALKSWLSGGRHVVNRLTWFGHTFRTQTGWGMPYCLGHGALDRARQYSRDMWMTDSWSGQVRPLSWLIDRFSPLPGWSSTSGADVLAQVVASGEAFYKERQRVSDTVSDALPDDGAGMAVLVGESDPAELLGASAVQDASMLPVEGQAVQALDVDSVRGDAASRSDLPGLGALQEGVCHKMVIGHHSDTHDGQNQRSMAESARMPSKGIIAYSDCRPDPFILEACRRQLVFAAGSIPIVSTSLKPVDLGMNIVLPLERGYLTMAKQILIALEMSTADVVFFCEHDVLYHPTHFLFTPDRDDTFYYNRNTWKVDSETGRALFYLCDQLSGLCGYRPLLREHFRKRVDKIEEVGFSRSMGFEPGTRNIRHGGIDDKAHEAWMSDVANIDIRHPNTLTASRWSMSQFRNKKFCAGWTEGGAVPGWGVTSGRFLDFISDVCGHV